MTSAGEIIFGVTQRGKRRLIDGDGYAYNINRVSKNKVEYYKCHIEECHGRIIYDLKTREAKVTLEHDSDVKHPGPTRRAKDAAIQKIRQLTLSADENTKAIEIVRNVLKELSPEVRLLMPTEPSLVRTIQRWAKGSNIQLARAGPSDYVHVLPEGEETPLDSTTMGGSKYSSDPTRTSTENAREFSKSYSESLGRRRNAKVQTLKRVDEDGNEIGTATLDDFLLGPTISNFQDRSTPSFFTSSDKRPAQASDDFDDLGVGDDDIMDHGDDDFQVDFEPEIQPVETQTAKMKLSTAIDSFNSPPKKRTKSTPPKDAVKSGELCFVCGDELIVSETLGASEQTFRTACRYLNVTSHGEWFPKTQNAKFYSFCESCTNEINRIHGLYQKIKEIQSLIFKKVESVEKRIADAEIVDNWMAEAPHSTAVRFEGFRKQVMINYRNKLKLRREIRFGKKTGKEFVEVLPGSSAHMYASDPGLDALRVPVETHRKSQVTRSRPKPKSKKPPEEREESNVENPIDFDLMLDNDGVHDNDFQNDFDDSQDSVSVRSEREVKFWENDPSKLEVHQQNVSQSENNKYFGEDENDNENDETHETDDSDPDYNEQENSNRSSKSMKIRRRKTNRIPKASRRNKGRKGRPSKVPKEGSDTPKSGRFPDAVLTKDGRVFMEGIEIIKNPPGVYKTRPYSVSFSCGVCGKIVLNFWNIRQHICGHHLGFYKCHICQKELTEPKVLEAHLETHGKRPYEECPICARPLKKYKRNLELHRWSHLSVEEKQDPKYKSWRPTRDKDPNTIRVAKQTFMCGQCGKTFKLPSMLKRHELKHGDGQTVSLMCQYCGRTYNDRKALSSHTSRCRNNANGRFGPNATTLPCPKCQKRFSSRETRARHIRKVHCKLPQPELLFSCPKCPRRFSTRGGFRAHKRVCVDGEKGYNVPKKSTDNQPSTSSSAANNVTSCYSDFKIDSSEAASSFLATERNQQSHGAARQGTLSSNTSHPSTALGFNYNFM